MIYTQGRSKRNAYCLQYRFAFHDRLSVEDLPCSEGRRDLYRHAFQSVFVFSYFPQTNSGVASISPAFRNSIPNMKLNAADSNIPTIASIMVAKQMEAMIVTYASGFR